MHAHAIRDEDVIEARERKARRKRGARPLRGSHEPLRIAEERGEAAIRARAGKRIEIAAEHVGARERIASQPPLAEELRRLHATLVAVHAEVRTDDVERATVIERGACPNRSAWLGGGMHRGERRHLDEIERVSTEQRVPVIARAAAERPTEEQGHLQMRREVARMVHALVLIGRRSVELLQRDDVRFCLTAHRDDVVDRVSSPGAHAAVDVVGHHANATEGARHGTPVATRVPA